MLAAGCLLLGVLAATFLPTSSPGGGLPCRIVWGTYVTGGPLATDMAPCQARRIASWYSWEPWAPPFAPDGTDIPLTAIAGGQFDAYIDSWAAGLRDDRYPVLLDFAHEMNGDWYPWGSGVNGNTPGQYVDAFRHVHDRFALAGATNVRFVWNPNNTSTSIAAPEFYPGDDYVDWLAIDAYNSNNSWASPHDEIAPIYTEISALNSRKPMMLAEVASQATPPAGAVPVDKAAWISDLAQDLPRSFPRTQSTDGTQ